MDTLKDIAVEASRLLNDSYDCDPEYNFTRWSKSELIEYGKDAIRSLFTLVPKKFTSVKKIELVPGKVQYLPEGCTKIVKVLNAGDNDNTQAVSSIANSVNSRLGNLFSDKCSGSAYLLDPSSYTIESFSLDESSDQIFYVEPPVPVSSDPIYANVICYGLPDIKGNYIVSDWMHNAVIEFILYRAYSSEDESANSSTNAKAHLEHFYTSIGNFLAAEKSMTPEMTRRLNSEPT